MFHILAIVIFYPLPADLDQSLWWLAHHKTFSHFLTLPLPYFLPPPILSLSLSLSLSYEECPLLPDEDDGCRRCREREDHLTSPVASGQDVQPTSKQHSHSGSQCEAMEVCMYTSVKKDVLRPVRTVTLDPHLTGYITSTLTLKSTLNWFQWNHISWWFQTGLEQISG